MKKVPLNIELKQIEIGQAECLHFIIPEETIGLKDIEIFVEYFADIQRKTVAFQIWSRRKDCPIRKYVCATQIPLEDRYGTPVDQIIYFINVNSGVHDYIRENDAWFRKNKRILETE